MVPISAMRVSLFALGFLSFIFSSALAEKCQVVDAVKATVCLEHFVEVESKAKKLGYKLIKIEDFELDADQYLKEHTKIALVGAYFRNGNGEESLSMKVPIITKGATREFRKLILQTPVQIPIFGIQLAILGDVEGCQVTNRTGSVIDENAPCLVVDTGWAVLVDPSYNAGEF